MKQENTTIVIGAGPYGLSATAHLRSQNVPTQIYGKPMEFWRNMPPDMFLKSTWGSLNLSDPRRDYTLDRYGKIHNIPRQDPVSLKTFLAYAKWFQEDLVPDIDQTYVTLLTRDNKGFHLELEDGRSLEAQRVVVASGVAPFAHIPSFAVNLPPELVTHTQQHTTFSQFKGKKVVVVGKGQSAMEAAALLYEAEAEVEVITRTSLVWINRRLHDHTGFAKHIFYPPSDIGPAGISWIVAFPLLFRHIPDKTRVAIDVRSVRPSAAKWLRPRVEGHFSITQQTSVESATEENGGLKLSLSNGTTRQVDHVILGTGYQPDVEALTYIDPVLRKQIQKINGYPQLNKWFEGSIPQLYFTGTLAGYAFGPLCRFVTGSGVPARQIARHSTMTHS